MRSIKIISSLFILASVSACGLAEKIGASRAYNYATVTHVSEHVNATRSFNENNPGIGIGSEAPFIGEKWAVGVEAGVYKNSNSETSPYAVTYFERDMIPSKPRALRMGFFTGYARYPAEARRFRDTYPVIGDFIPVVGLQATFPTFGSHEFRLRATPGLNQSSSIISLQSNFVF